MRFLRLALAFAALVLPAHAWDAEGHKLIARLALDQMNPRAKSEIENCARELVYPGKSYDFITIACWMDDIRKAPDNVPFHGEFPSWHYIDIGLAPGDPPQIFDPGSDNEMRGDVVTALLRAMVVLKGGTDPYVKSKAVACAMVMHLVGDIHQPLHCASRYFHRGDSFPSRMWHDDRGGNEEQVINGRTTGFLLNLHYFWDDAYRATFDAPTGEVEFLQYIKIADLHDISPPANATKSEDFAAWANETNAIARAFVYPGLTAADEKHCRLSSTYVEKTRAIARAQLVLAANRLARIMNETLGADPAPVAPPSYPAGPL